MPNNNVAILSIMSKFDEKSAREAAKRADKVYEEALSDIGNVNFDKKLIENFDKAMNLLKNKFKKVNLSSYTNSLLDSIFSDKDIKEKTKDIESFISKIEMLKKASSGQDINAFNTFSAKQIDALISRTEKLAQKQEEINEKTREYNREATKIAKANRSISTIDKNYGNQDYSKTLESLKKSLGTEKEFTAEQNQSIENLAKMVNLYQVMEKSEPQKGTAEAIRYSKDLLAVTQKIKEERDKIDAFSKKGASTYITNNGLSSIDKVSDYTVSKSKEDFVKASLSNLKSQEAKLQSELTTYISESVQKNLAKVSKEVDAVVDKAEKRVENLQNKIESLQTKSTKTGSDNSIIGGIVSNSDIKTLEEIEDRLFAIQDKYLEVDENGYATNGLSTKELKEFISLYKEYEQLPSDNKFESDLPDTYKSIIESDKNLKKYADTLDKTISKQKEFNEISSNDDKLNNKPDKLSSIDADKLETDLNEIKETIIEISKKVDNLNNENSFSELSSQVGILDEKLNNVNGSVDKLVESIQLLSSLSLSDLQKTLIPIYNGINQVYKDNNGNRISGYWNALKQEVESSNTELKNLLKTIGLFDSKSNSLKLINDGMENSGGIIGDDKVLIARKNRGDRFEEKNELKKRLDEAYEAGINVSRILDIIGTKESNVFFDIQEKASGNILGNIYGQNEEDFVNMDWLYATDEQIKKLVADMIKLQEMGINVESNLTNIIYDKEKGFSFIDMDLGITDFENNAELMQDHMMRIFGDLEDFYIDKNDSVNENLIKSVRKRFEDLSMQVQEAYANAQDSNSPSKEFEKLENDAVDGVVIGANENEEKLKNVGKQMAENVKAGFKEGISEIDSELSLDKSNISSENEIPKSIENTTNAITEQTNALKELILSWVEAQKVMSKSGSASTEKIAVGNLSNGFVSNSNFTGDLNSISDKLIRNIIENATETVDTIIHSHPDYNLAAFSPEDIASSIIRFATGIQNQIVVGMDEISIMDVSKIKDINPLEIKNKIEQELSSLINSYIKNQLQNIDNLQSIFTNNLSGGLDEWSTFTDLISENTNSDFLKNVIQKYKDSISDALINMGSDYKFSNSDELGTFIYENIIKKYVRSYVSNSNPDINQSEYDALQKEALENFKKEFSAIYDKAFSIKDYESLLTDNEIQPIVKEAFSNILKTFGLKYEDVIKTISVEQLKTSSISPIKDVFQGDDNSNTSFSSNLDEIEKEKSALLELRNAVSLITEEIDRKTQAFHNEKSAVDLIIPEEIATLESLERELKIIIESIEQISKIPINIDFNLENLDENSTNAISKLKDSLSGFNGSSLTNISSILEGFKISKANVENLQKLANAILTLKSNLNNVGNSGQQFLSDIKELVAQSDGLKDLATVLKSTQKQIDNAKKTTNTNVDSKNTKENANTWKELTYSIQRYSEVSKRISSGKALEGDIEEASRLENKISQLQKLDILSSTQIEKSEQMLTKLYDTLDDIEKKSKETTLESLNSSIDKYRNDYNSRSSKPFVDNQSDKYKKLLANYETSIAKLEAYRDKIRNNPLVSNEDLNQINELTKKVKESATAFNSLTSSQKGSTPLSRGKAIEWANDLLEQNSKWSKKAKIEVQGWINKLASADPSNVEEIRNRILEVVRAEREAGNAGKTWLDIFSTKKLHHFLGQAASMFSFYDLINVGREIVTNIKEVDTALTELRKVSDATEQRLTTNFKNSADTAKELGATISDVISATADWSRMGYNIDQAEELARVSTLYKNVGDGIDIETANNSLISTLQGFQLDASEAESIIDKFNEVANNYAIDSAGIGEALQRSAASFNAANTDLSKSIALITATNEVVQDPDSVGTLWKTMSARIRGAETELEELGEETDEYTKTTSKLRDLVQSLTGFDIMIDEDTFKDVYEIILGIGKEWDNLTDVEQASLGEALAGKRNANALYAVLGNLDTLQAAYETAENSAGSAMREQENYEKSIQYSLDRLSASAQEWSNTLVSSDVIKWFVDLANAAVELSTALTPLGTLALGGGIFAGIKNIGRPKMFGLYKYADINMCSLGY